MSNLVIVSICVTDRNLPSEQQGWQTPMIFNEDTELPQLEAMVAAARSREYTVSQKVIHGMAVEPLREYLNQHTTI